MSKGRIPCVIAKRSENVDSIIKLPELQANYNLWYKIHVLLYDLCNIANDRAAELRTLATTDELCISAPYFTPSEATLIKTTLVLPPILNEIPEFETLGFEEEEEEEEEEDVETLQKHPEKELASRQPPVPHGLVTIEEAIETCLQNFFEKRRASGDARPCGPHDMGPIYLAVFGVAKEKLKEERFLNRLRRAGLPRLEAEVEAKVKSKQETKKAGKKGSRKS